MGTAFAEAASEMTNRAKRLGRNPVRKKKSEDRSQKTEVRKSDFESTKS